MRTILAFLCHSVLLLTAFLCSHSVSGFVLNGPALSLLLDRYLLHAFSWTAPVNWSRELCTRAAYFVFGAVVFFLLRPGIVPWWEAAYRGALVSVTAFAVETLAGLTDRFRLGWCVWLGALALVVFSVPVAAALHPLHTVPKRTPAALGLAFEDVRFRSADGLRLAGWVVPHPQARGTVVLCHGHGRNRGHLAGLLPGLHEMGLNVLAFDFRGHGDSDGHTSVFGCREVEDLRAAVALARARFPGQPLFLVGISLGAAVSLQALPHLPGVRGVWSEGAFARLGGPVAQVFRPLLGWLRVPLVQTYHWLGWLDCGVWVPEVNPVEGLAGTNVPVYFCHGRKDELVPFSEGETLYAAYPGPKGHWWVENASHYNVRQRNSEEYRRRLQSFLEECLGKTEAISEPAKRPL